jgi:hypothetical protein
MRLLDVNTYKLKEFIGDDIPPYAILSHTWGEEEVLYRDIEERSLPKLKKRLGFKKIQFCAQQAKEDRFSYCWVDTCCIDKSSSAELSEAINSMYSWYKQAAVCYAYLEDMSIDCSAFIRKVDPFSRCRWFRRGWTLQEMIAPQNLRLYNKDWICTGDKSDYGTLIALCQVTGVPEKVMRTGNVGLCCIAQRMSWAAGRRTTRAEDRAYSLLGIFGVNMPLIYGEGEKAFLRLQKEIMESSDDDSIFAWLSTQTSYATLRGLLARSPDEFDSWRNIDFIEAPLPTNDYEFSMTQIGVRGTWLSMDPPDEYPELGIMLNTRTDHGRPVIKLAHLYIYRNGVPIMVRVDSGRIHWIDLKHLRHIDLSTMSVMECIVRQDLARSTLPTSKQTRIAGFYMDFDESIWLDESSPPGCLTRQGRLWRFTAGILDALLSANNHEVETTSIDITTEPCNLVMARFMVHLSNGRAVMICAFNLSSTQSNTITWAGNATVGPLRSWSCLGLCIDGVFKVLRWARVETSLQLINEEFVIGSRIRYMHPQNIELSLEELPIHS